MRERLDIRLRRALRRGRGRATPRPALHVPIGWICLALTACVVGLLELRLRPVVQALAARQIERGVAVSVTDAIRQLDADYSSLVRFQRDEGGTITAVSADMGQANRIRTEIVSSVLDAVAMIDCNELGVPLGSLLDLDLFWGKGPVIRVRGLTAGTVDARLNSEFRSAGVNQTLHRVMLDMDVPISVLLPGGCARTEVHTSICLAETLIVGRVPQTYLTFGQYGRENEYGRETGDPPPS